MTTPFRPLVCLFAGVGALGLILGDSSVPRAQFLPVFTSPIDITGLKVQLRFFAPDRETGQPVSVPRQAPTITDGSSIRFQLRAMLHYLLNSLLQLALRPFQECDTDLHMQALPQSHSFSPVA
jgi:hypothetical protein